MARTRITSLSPVPALWSVVDRVERALRGVCSGPHEPLPRLPMNEGAQVGLGLWLGHPQGAVARPTPASRPKLDCSFVLRQTLVAPGNSWAVLDGGARAFVVPCILLQSRAHFEHGHLQQTQEASAVFVDNGGLLECARVIAMQVVNQVGMRAQL